MAIFLVIFAVLISALRLFLPYAHNYRLDLQNYINETYESNILIGSLNMNWQSNGPTLEADNVSILQTQGVDIFIASFDISFDFWKSIREQRLITRDFTLDGVKILLDNKALTSNNMAAKENDLLSNVSELFLKQIGRFSVKNSQIVYRAENIDKTFLVSQIDWLNQGHIHKAKGSVILDGLTSNNLQLNLHIEGEKLSEMKGELYVEAKSVNITPWLDTILVIDNENTHSSVNFSAWLSIDKGQAKTLQVELGDNQLAWQHNHSIQMLNIDEGQIVVKNLDKPSSLQVASSNINIRSNERNWQPFNVEMSKGSDSTKLHISSINIAGIIDLLPLVIVDPETNYLLEKLNVIGDFSDVYFDFYDDKIATIAQFSDLNTTYSDGIPGIQNLSGELLFKDNHIALNLRAENGALDFDKHFIAPIKYQTFTSDLFIQLDNDAWHVTSDNIHFISEELKIIAELGLSSRDGNEPELSLFAKAIDGNTLYAQTFYPHLLMGDDLVDYLNGALEQGQLEQALVLINGPLSSFPYENNNGTFVVDAELVKGSFKFDNEWQAISHFDANLNFTNNSMMITGREGLLSGISVSGVKVGIDDLSEEQVLTVDAVFSNTAPALVTNLMLTSPYNESVGTVLEQVVINENISGSFNLYLPLNDTSKALAQGDIAFKNNNISLQSPSMYFTSVNGNLLFKNEEITVNGLEMLWRNMPLSLDVSAYNNDEYYHTGIHMDASWEMAQWEEQVPNHLRKYAQGQLDWQGVLNIKNHHDGAFSYQMDIGSNLINTKLLLPAPFTKDSADNATVKILVEGNENQSSIDVKLDNRLKFFGNLNHQQVAFTQSHLVLGEEEMYLPFSGFHITAGLENAKFEEWQPFISDILNSLPEENKADEHNIALFEQPERIRGTVNTLTFLDEEIHDVSFDLADKINWWELDLTSKEARGIVKIFPDWLSQGLEVNADFIHLAPNKVLFNSITEDTAQTAVDEPEIENSLIKEAVFDIRRNDEFFAQIPTLAVKCESCRYGNLNLGSTSFTLNRPSNDLLKLNNFMARRGSNRLMFDGQWLHSDVESRTSLVGSLQVKDLERELEQLKISTTVKDSGLKSTFDMNWQGGIKDIALDTLNGDLSAKLDEGYLAEVPDQARAFSILSLQSLVRKLKFDFRDIFSDGMFYSEIKGDFHLKDGILYTKNTFLKGAAGDLSVKGNTNLLSETLDYSMSYKPNLTSSLPAIAWIATLNPVTFLAGIAIDEVITSQVVSEYKIEVTGSIDKPKIKEVDRKTQNISVGRDAPPQIVEHIKEPELLENKAIINPETGLIQEVGSNDG